jgi:hypothetical protein
MGFNLNGIGGLIGKLPGGGEAVNIINQIGNPIMSVANPFINIMGSGLEAMMTLPVTLMQSATKMATGLANTLSQPTIIYIIVGCVAVGGIYEIQSGAITKFK